MLRPFKKATVCKMTVSAPRDDSRDPLLQGEYGFSSAILQCYCSALHLGVFLCATGVQAIG